MTSFRQQTFQKIRRNSNVVKNRFAVNWSSTIDVGDIQSVFATGIGRWLRTRTKLGILTSDSCLFRLRILATFYARWFQCIQLHSTRIFQNMMRMTSFFQKTPAGQKTYTSHENVLERCFLIGQHAKRVDDSLTNYYQNEKCSEKVKNKLRECLFLYYT